MPATPETIIAFDFGLRRIGVAVGQQVTSAASPLTVITNGKNGPDWQKIASLLDVWRPARLIVGMPSHADGSPSALTDAVNEFVDALGRFELPVETVDERYSSIEAEAILRAQRADGLAGRISKTRIDSGAAALIAERWLKKEQQ
jgi:putative Holliday junction resolvase